MPVMRPWASRRHSGRVSRIVIPTMGPENLPFWMDFTPSLSTVLNVATESAPFQARLAGVLLSARQIEHRRRMLEFGRQLGTTTVAPISRRASRSLSLASASWRRSIGSMNGSWLSRND